MSRISVFSLGAALAVALLAGCPNPEPGEAGNIEFTPRNCGLLECDFADTIGVGGVIDMRIAGIGDFDVTGVTLESDNSEVLMVNYLGMQDGMPIWELQAMEPGQASIVARRDGVQVDTLKVQTRLVTDLLVRPFFTDIDVQQDIFGYDWYVLIEPEENELVSLRMIPAVGDDQVMGRYDYMYEIVDAEDADEAPTFGTIAPEFMAYIEDRNDLDRGMFTFTVPMNAPAGEYRATFAPVYYGEEVSTQIGIGIISAP